MNKFDKPYRFLPTYDNKKILELFNLVNELDTNELLKYSLSNQISFDIINDLGDSLIHEVIKIDKRKAREHVKLNVIKFLVQNGANPDSPNKMNQTPLHLACHLQLELIVKYLLEEVKVNPNYTDNLGLYPFHYLFSGEIKLLDRSSEIAEFVPKKKVEAFNTNELVEVKRTIWEAIGGDNMVTTIDETINKLIEDDDAINDRVLKLYQLLDKLKMADPSSQKSPQIIDDIKAFNEGIINKIKEKFSNFKVEEIEFHQTESNSWLPDGIDKFDYSLIKNGNYKKRIRKEILEEFDRINKLIIEYRDIEVNFKIDEDSDMNFFIEKLNNKIIKIPDNKGKPVDWNIYSNIRLDQPTWITNLSTVHKINNQLRHPHVINYASSKIDFKNLTYLGGSNKIEVEFNISILAGAGAGAGAAVTNNYFEKILKEILNTGPIINSEEYKKVIFYFLFDRDYSNYNIVNDYSDNIPANFKSSFDNLDSKIKLKDLLNIVEINDIFGGTRFYNQVYSINQIAPIKPAGSTPYANDNINHYRHACLSSYILINYTMILYKENLIILLELLEKNEPYNKNNFFIKYCKIIKKSNYDEKLITYEMMCELHYILGQKISFSNIMLITGLNNNKTNIVQGILNALKPHLISKYLKTNDNLLKCIILLLNDNINKEFYNDFIVDNTNQYIITEMNKTNTYNLNANIKYLVEIINEYINYNGNDDKFIDRIRTKFINSNNELLKYYTIFNKNNNKNNIEVFKLMILSIYEETTNKPMKQTLIDFLYLLELKLKNSVPLVTNKNNDIKYISIIDNNNNTYDIATINTNKKNQPSYFGHMNDAKNHSHFIIAHLMGLFYEGIINEKDIKEFNNYNGNNYQFNIINNDCVGILLPLNYIKLNGAGPSNYDLLDNHNDFNIFNINGSFNADNGNNAQPAGAAGAPAAPGAAGAAVYGNMLKQTITEFNYRPPTTNNIRKTYETRINEFKREILGQLYKFNEIINELSNGVSKNLHKLYTVIYPEILKLNKLLGNLSEGEKYKFKDQELVKFLNKINALFYIYYKIKNDGTKMSKFNNYLLNDRVFLYNATFGTVAPVAPGAPGARNYNELIDFDKLISQTGGADKDAYDNILDLYNGHGGIYYHFNVSEDNKDFDTNDPKKLPESLYNDFSTYYKYALIELISKAFDTQTVVTPPRVNYDIIKGKLNNYINSLNLNVDVKELAGKFIVVQLINELLKQHFESHISQAIVKLYANKNDHDKIDKNEYFVIKEFKIDLTTLNFPVIKELKELKQVKNMYSIINKPNKVKNFIIYPNDFTNMSKFKIKYSFNINKDVIETLLVNNSLLFSQNLENTTPIYSLLKINNNDVIREIKNQLDNYDIKLNNFKKDGSLDFIKQECINNLSKVINSDENPNINDIFKNINGYLYDDVKALILSNENFGNNMLSYLEESFSMSSYLILEYLSDYVTNQDNFTVSFDEKIYSKLLNNLKYTVDNLNKNYLASIIDTFKISSDVDQSIAEQVRDELINEYTFIKSEMEKFTNSSNKKRTLLETKMKDLRDRYEQIKSKLSIPLNIITSKSITNSSLIERYNKLHENDKEILIIHAWSKLLGTGKLEGNYNLILIKMLIQQNKLINKLDNKEDLDKLNTINLTLQQISNLCEDYFNGKKYYEENDVLKTIFHILEYLTRMVICNGIEYMMRRILFNYYFESSNSENNLDFIHNRIEYIITTKIKDFDKSLHEILFENISKRLVKTATGIYNDNEDELLFQSETTRDILTEFFDHLKVFPYLNDIKPVFDSQVVSYFDTFVGRTILLWMVNIENIFKFFINNYRSTDILLMLND